MRCPHVAQLVLELHKPPPQQRALDVVSLGKHALKQGAGLVSVANLCGKSTNVEGAGTEGKCADQR